jgi:hypothetical protein
MVNVGARDPSPVPGSTQDRLEGCPSSPRHPLQSVLLWVGAAATNLIAFLKTLPDCRMGRGIQLPQWWMLQVAILPILRKQGSLLGTERVALATGVLRWSRAIARS